MIDLAPLLRACAFSLRTNRRLGMRTSTDLHYIACQCIRSSISLGSVMFHGLGRGKQVDETVQSIAVLEGRDPLQMETEGASTAEKLQRIGGLVDWTWEGLCTRWELIEGIGR